MPICIAGMHRSGTSMVTRMLSECGLDLGPVDELGEARPTNRDGQWENERLVGVNDELLATYGGAWYSPPELPWDWAGSDAVAPVHTRAQRTVDELALGEPWGWKDPRSSLTLPFWKRLFPDLLVVICLRHPREVTASLTVRDGLTEQTGFGLWERYYAALLEGVEPKRRVVTHYQAYFDDPRSEIARVAEAIGLGPSDAEVDRAVTAVSPELRHHVEHVTADTLPPEVAANYAALLAESGYRVATRRSRPPEPETDELRARVEALTREIERRTRHLAQQLTRIDKARARLEAGGEAGDAPNVLAALEERLYGPVEELNRLRAEVEWRARSEAEWRARLESQREELEWRTATETALRAEVDALKSHLAAIESTRVWRTGERYKRLKAAVKRLARAR